MERLKPIARNATVAADTADRYRPELVADDEPRYLRRQKPVEIRRKKLAGRGWVFYRRLLLVMLSGGVVVTASLYAVRFLLYSSSMLLAKPEQIEVNGNHIVTREAVLQQFVIDRNRSVLRISLDDRRAEIERLPWVESATVERILPNRVRVHVTERTPIAFVRNGSELALIDAHGVILDRPRDEDLRFPVISGVSEDIALDQREKRMQLYQDFIKGIELVRGGASQTVSEADLTNPKDLRVVMTGLTGPTDTQAVAIQFGASDFSAKYKMLVDNFLQWQANAGRVQSIDLQYSRQVVVNPEANAVTAARKAR